jgi:hypothetical protein
LAHPKLLNEKIVKYADESKPKIGWDGLVDLNHFDLISKIFSVDLRYKRECTQLINQENLSKTIEMVDKCFTKLYSYNRLTLIKICLEHRFNRLIDIVK